MQGHALQLLCARHALGPGDVAAKKTEKVPRPQGERGNKPKEWDGVRDGSFERHKEGVTYDKDRWDSTLTR